MAKYINVAKQLVRLYRLNLDCEDVIKEFLVTAEPEEVVKVKHGEWIIDENDPEHNTQCSMCGFVLDDWIQGAFYNFCPNCGADLRKEKEDDKSRMDK